MKWDHDTFFPKPSSVRSRRPDVRKQQQQQQKPLHIDGLVYERRNYIANALELRLSSTNLSIY